MLNAAELNKKIKLRSKTGDTVDSDGYNIPGEIVEIPVWAKIKTLQSKEYFDAKAVQSENTTVFVIRYRKDMNEDMVILFKDRQFEIISLINDDEKNITYTIIGREVI